MKRIQNLNVFADFHHASLLHSFILLFEGRFGGKVYRPIGREWYDRGYWAVYDHPATAAQFLDIGGATPDGTEPLNQVVDHANEVYKCFDIDSRLFNKAITYQGFMARPFDIVIASIPNHIKPFRLLCDSHPHKPKLIYQIGNAWNISDEDAAMVDGIMASSKLENIPAGLKIVIYHQEFDTSIFHPAEGIPAKNVFSFINCFNVDGLFAHDWQLFTRMERSMPDWVFKSYGGQCRDGAAHGSRELATAMRSARFIWHTKRGGDGYGHIIHNAFAVGRPSLIKMEYYRGKMASDLLVDGETCISIDNLNIDQIKNKIEYYSKISRYELLQKSVYNKFKQIVNFDKDAHNIEVFLDEVIQLSE